MVGRGITRIQEELDDTVKVYSAEDWAKELERRAKETTKTEKKEAPVKEEKTEEPTKNESNLGTAKIEKPKAKVKTKAKAK